MLLRTAFNPRKVSKSSFSLKLDFYSLRGKIQSQVDDVRHRMSLLSSTDRNLARIGELDSPRSNKRMLFWLFDFLSAQYPLVP
jgi:hypothetical protein